MKVSHKYNKSRIYTVYLKWSAVPKNVQTDGSPQITWNYKLTWYVGVICFGLDRCLTYCIFTTIRFKKDMSILTILLIYIWNNIYSVSELEKSNLPRWSNKIKLNTSFAQIRDNIFGNVDSSLFELGLYLLPYSSNLKVTHDIKDKFHTEVPWEINIFSDLLKRMIFRTIGKA